MLRFSGSFHFTFFIQYFYWQPLITQDDAAKHTFYQINLRATNLCVQQQQHLTRRNTTLESPPNGKLKFGENVRVFKYVSNRIVSLLFPTAVIEDINAKPAVSIKNESEQFSLALVQRGESKAIYTAIWQDAHVGERIVTGNVYQIRIIYKDQQFF